MKTILRVALAALSLVAAAHAGEGNGEPFPSSVPGLTTVSPRAYAADTGSAAFPDLAGRPSWMVAAGGVDVLPSNGSEGAVQTANSLPRGALDGTVAYAQAESVRRHLAQQAGRPAQVAQAPGGKPRG